MATEQKSPSESGEWLGRYTLPESLSKRTPVPSATAGDVALRTAPDVPVLWCAECHLALRTCYYALNGERALCADCKQPFEDKVALGTGPEALSRALLWGTGAAAGAALLLGGALVFFGFLQLFAAIAIGWFVARVIGRATANYGGRQYQWIAVLLTYAALGAAFLVPVVRDTIALAQAQDAATSLPEATQEALASSPFGETGPLGAVVNALLLMLTLPLVAPFAYGISGAAVAYIALAVAVRKVWDMTSCPQELNLTGPFRVGRGPIEPSV
jgi:hypothetical protein